MSEGGKPDLLGGNPPPKKDDPPEPPDRKPRKLICGACGCELAMDGTVLHSSTTWRELEKAQHTIADLQGRLDTAKQELEDLKAPKPHNGPPEKEHGEPDNIPPARSAFSY